MVFSSCNVHLTLVLIVLVRAVTKSYTSASVILYVLFGSSLEFLMPPLIADLLLETSANFASLGRIIAEVDDAA